MGNVSRSFYRDYKKAQDKKLADKKSVRVIRLTKSGQPSKLQGDTVLFYTVDEANKWIARFMELNPNSSAKFLIEEK